MKLSTLQPEKTLAEYELKQAQQRVACLMSENKDLVIKFEKATG